MRQRRLAHPGQILDQQMATGQQAGYGLTDFNFLAQNDFSRLLEDGIERLGACGE